MTPVPCRPLAFLIVAILLVPSCASSGERGYVKPPLDRASLATRDGEAGDDGDAGEDGEQTAEAPQQLGAAHEADSTAVIGSRARLVPDLRDQLESNELGQIVIERAQRALPRSAARVLQRLVAQGTLDASALARLAAWSRVLAELESRFRIDVGKLIAKHLTSRSITAAELTALGGELCEITVRQIMKQRGARRVKLLHDMLKLQPNDASRARLLKAYHREVARAGAPMAKQGGVEPRS